MGIHEVTQSEPFEKSIGHNAVVHNDSGRDREGVKKRDQDSRASRRQNGRSEGIKSDCLPGLGTLSAGMNMNSFCSCHNEGDRSSSLP